MIKVQKKYKKLSILQKKILILFSSKSLGYENYLSLINLSDGAIGNSSSGIIEVPTFKKLQLILVIDSRVDQEVHLS